MANLKNLLLRGLLRFSGRTMRSRLPRSIRRLYWNKVCAPYLCWRELDMECRTRFGFRMMVRPKEFVENRIGFFGAWEPSVTSLFTERVRPGSVVVDVGANVGYFSLLASRLVGAEGKVYAVEPSPSIRARLSHNLQLNDVTNVTVLPYAAWNEPGEATFYVASHDVGNSTLSAQRAHRSTETVRLARLDDLIPKQDFSRISLVKVDVEGAEYHALKGMMGMLQSNERIALIVEISPSVMEEFGSSSQALLELLEGLGYEGCAIPNDYSVDAYLSSTAKAPLQTLAIDSTQIVDALFTRKEGLTAASAADRLAAAPMPTFSGPRQP